MQLPLSRPVAGNRRETASERRKRGASLDPDAVGQHQRLSSGFRDGNETRKPQYDKPLIGGETRALRNPLVFIVAPERSQDVAGSDHAGHWIRKPNARCLTARSDPARAVPFDQSETTRQWVDQGNSSCRLTSLERRVVCTVVQHPTCLPCGHSVDWRKHVSHRLIDRGLLIRMEPDPVQSPARRAVVGLPNSTIKALSGR